MAILSRGFIVVLAALAVVALATTAADTTNMFREQAELEAFEDYGLPREASESESLIDAESQAEAEADADGDDSFFPGTNWDEDTTLVARVHPISKVVVVREPEAPPKLENATVAKIIDPVRMVPVVVQHDDGLRTVVTPAVANTLLTRLYDRNPWAPATIADRLPESARIALWKVLGKSTDPDVQVAITASFLAAFTTDNVPAEAEAQTKAKALLETSSDKAAMDNTDMAFDESRAMILLQLGDAPAAAAPTAPVAPAAAAAAPVPAAAAPAPTSSEEVDAGVVALNKYSDLLMGEAQILSKKIEELKKLNGPSVFKVMNRGPVGRRPTDKDRQQTFTIGLRSWDAKAQNDAFRARGGISQSEADRMYSVEPIPK